MDCGEEGVDWAGGMELLGEKQALAFSCLLLMEF